jgi:hypothetical protein
MPFLLRSPWAVSLVTAAFPVGISRGSAWRWRQRPHGLNASSLCQRAASPWPFVRRLNAVAARTVYGLALFALFLRAEREGVGCLVRSRALEFEAKLDPIT